MARWDCPDPYFFPKPDPDPVGVGIKIPTFNEIGTGNPVKTGIETMESRGITLLDSKSEWVVFTEGTDGIENPEKMFCQDRNRDEKTTVPPDPTLDAIAKTKN